MFRGVTRREHHVMLVLVALFFTGLGIHQFRRNQPYQPVVSGPAVSHRPGELALELPSESEASLREAVVQGLIDINLAPAALLEELPGIGPAKAAAIVQYREQNGPFRHVGELTRVPGIGEKTLESLAPLVTVGEVAAPAGAPAAAAPVLLQQPAAPSPAAPATINLNTASAEELQLLDGVGPVLAQRIVEDRMRRGPFRTVEEWTRVSGIGPVVLKKNRHRLTVH